MIFGAGKVGRGFLAEIFQQAGFAILFVDKNINLVDQINRRGRYSIFKARGALTDSVVINDVKAHHFSDEGAIVDALCDEDAVAAIAISPFMLDDTAGMLAIAIARRALECPSVPFDIFLCDNSADPATRMRDKLEGMLGGSAIPYLNEEVGLIRTIVMRLSSDHPPQDADDPLALLNNGYPQLPVDAHAFHGALPESSMIRPSDNFQAESTRKIYTLNMAQAAMAYLGQPLGVRLVTEALRHPRVRPVIQQALEEAAHGLCGEFGFARRQMDEWNQSILMMLENPVLGDSILRYGIDAGRKVGPIERLVGPATLCQKYDRPPHSLAHIIAYAYLYKDEDPGTRRLQNSVTSEGVEITLEHFSRIDYRNPLRPLILEEYQRALRMPEA